MQKEGRTLGGTYRWKQYTNEETTKQRNRNEGNIHTEGHISGGEYGRKGHTHGEDICTRRGHAYGGDVHVKGHIHGGIHTDEHILGGTHTAGTYIRRGLHMKGHTHASTYTRRNIHTERTYALNRLCSYFKLNHSTAYLLDWPGPFSFLIW